MGTRFRLDGRRIFRSAYRRPASAAIRSLVLVAIVILLIFELLPAALVAAANQ